MAAQITIKYDSAQAKKGLQELQKDLDATSKSTTKLGDESVKAAAKIDKSLQQANKTVQQSTSRIGTLGGQIVSLGTSLGVVGGTSGAIAGATAAFGELGVAAVALGGVIGSLVSIHKDLTNEVGRTASELEGLKSVVAQATTSMAEYFGVIERGLSDLEALDRQKEAFDTARMRGYRAELEKVFAINAEFKAMQKARADEEEAAQIRANVANNTALETRLMLGAAIEEEAAIIEKGISLTGSLFEVEKERERINELLRKAQERIGALRDRQRKLEEEERNRERAWLVEQERKEQELHVKRVRQLEERKRRELEIAAIKDKDADERARALLGQGGGVAGGAGQPAAIVPGGVADENGVIRGRDKGPLQFAGSAIAANVMGRQAALSQGAMGRMDAARQQASTIRMGNADRQARGDFSMDKRRGPTVREMRAGAAGGDGAAEGGEFGQFQQAIPERQLKDQIAANRLKGIEQRRRAAILEQEVDQFGVVQPLSDKRKRAIDRQFDREADASRRGVFRLDNATEEERSQAAKDIFSEQAQEAQEKLREQVAANRVGEIDQRRRRSLRGASPEDRERINAQADREKREARAGVARGEFGAEEQAAAVKDLADKSGRAAAQLGKNADDLIGVVQKAVEVQADEIKRGEQRDNDIDALKAAVQALTGRQRQRAQRGGRGG